VRILRVRVRPGIAEELLQDTKSLTHSHARTHARAHIHAPASQRSCCTDSGPGIWANRVNVTVEYGIHAISLTLTDARQTHIHTHTTTPHACRHARVRAHTQTQACLQPSCARAVAQKCHCPAVAQKCSRLWCSPRARTRASSSHLHYLLVVSLCCVVQWRVPRIYTKLITE